MGLMKTNRVLFDNGDRIIKQLIQVRGQYPNIFEEYPLLMRCNSLSEEIGEEDYKFIQNKKV